MSRENLVARRRREAIRSDMNNSRYRIPGNGPGAITSGAAAKQRAMHLRRAAIQRAAQRRALERSGN